MKCPYCAGEIPEQNNSAILICPYCDSEIKRFSEKQQTTKEPEPLDSLAPAQKLFDIRITTLPDDPYDVFQSLCAHLNQGKTVEDYIRLVGAVENKHIALPGKNQALLEKVLRRFPEISNNNERVLFYIDDGLLSKGKSGLLLTEKKIYFSEKNILPVSDVVSIDIVDSKSFNIWRLNGSSKYSIPTLIDNGNKVKSLVLATICTLAREQNKQGFKIMVQLTNL